MEEYLIPRWLYINFVRLLTKDYVNTTCKIYIKPLKQNYKIYVECSNGILLAGTSGKSLEIITEPIKLSGYIKKTKYNKEYSNALAYLQW